MNALKQGIKVESEHRGTVRFLRQALAKGRKVSDKAVFARIAKDHLKEDPKYYEKLKLVEGKK
jgi:hypothetical protein